MIRLQTTNVNLPQKKVESWDGNGGYRLSPFQLNAFVLDHSFNWHDLAVKLRSVAFLITNFLLVDRRPKNTNSTSNILFETKICVHLL